MTFYKLKTVAAQFSHHYCWTIHKTKCSHLIVNLLTKIGAVNVFLLVLYASNSIVPCPDRSVRSPIVQDPL